MHILTKRLPCRRPSARLLSEVMPPVTVSNRSRLAASTVRPEKSLAALRSERRTVV